jgi:hypothetical protein
MAGQSRASRCSGGVVPEHCPLTKLPGSVGHAPAEHDVLARAEALGEPLGHAWGRRRRMLVDGPKGAAAEEPHGHRTQRRGVAAGEGTAVALPTPGVHGAAEHDGRVAGRGRRPRMSGRASASQPAERIVRAMRSAISAVDSCLLAYATSTVGLVGGHVTPPRHPAR